MGDSLCIKNYRLIGFDTLSGISVLIEYDKILDSQELILYGVEETGGQACSLLLAKAVQALAGSVVIPWIPYRVSGDIVARAGQCLPPVKTAVHQVESNPPEINCHDARLLDAHYGELAMLAKLLALMPGEGTLYTRLAKAAAENTIELLGASNPTTEIYKTIKEISHSVKENIIKIKELIERIEREAVKTGDIEKYIADTSKAAEQPHLLEEYARHCDNKTNIIILVPKIYVTHSLKEMIKTLTEDLKNKNIKVEKALIIGYDTPTINTTMTELASHLHDTKISKIIITRVDQTVIKKIHSIADRECLLIATLLDFGKEDYKTIQEVLQEKQRNNEVKALLQAWTLYRIRYEYNYKKREATLRTRPVTAYYNLQVTTQ